MIKEKLYKGTSYSNVNAPIFKGLMDQTIYIEHDAKKIGNELDWKIDVHCIMKEVNGDKVFEVLQSQSRYVLTIENGVTAKELFEVVKNAVDNLKKCPSCEEEEKKQLYLSSIQYPPFNRDEELKMQEIADAF